MHGCGNDYIYVDASRYPIAAPADTAKRWSSPHTGIGSDGLVLIGRSPIPEADFTMRIFNADGSEAQMCGNAIRCVAKYLYESGLCREMHMQIETLAGIRTLTVHVSREEVDEVMVNMGKPLIQPSTLQVDRNPIGYTSVNMGNPHAVFFLEDNPDLSECAAEEPFYGDRSCDALGGIPLETIGPAIESSGRFPNGVNSEFIELISPEEISFRVWERGSGETLACGTGACAVTVACILNGLTEDEITVSLLGGDLKIKWDRDENIVYMTGPATTVFDGVIAKESGLI
jgi:diaminopimelate epimerase